MSPSIFGVPKKAAPSVSYHNLGPLGKGGMGSVFRGLRVESDGLGNMSATQVALKMPLEGPAHDRSLRMLLATHQRLSNVKLPGVPRPIEMTECDGKPCLAMELVQGKNLSELNKDKYDLLEAVSIIMSVIPGLKSLQRKLPAHADMNFKNIMLRDEDGTARVVDFEIAICHLENMFREDELGGTFGYIAPELFLKESPSAKSDIFSLGMILADMLLGYHPFNVDKEKAQIDILRGKKIPLIGFRNIYYKSLERELNRILNKACANNKDERYQSFNSFAKDLAKLVLRVPLRERMKMDQRTQNRLAQWKIIV